MSASAAQAAASMPAGRIPETAFKAVTGLIFGIAIIAAIVRGAIRVQTRKRLALDDYLLAFACICLTASTGLLYWGLPYIYFSEQLTLSAAGGSSAASAGVNYAEINQILSKLIIFQKVNWAYLAVSWTAIYSVKLAFLAFFRGLVDRLPRLLLFWKILVVFTCVVFCFAVCDAFIACPKVGMDALSCSQGKGVARALALGSTAISLDIVTDMLILTIPISLLYRVQISTRQKLGLAAFLCLSIFMIVVAAIRVSGFHYKGTWDNTWIFFWQQVEASVAVCMISVTAFRSAFVADGSKKRSGGNGKSSGRKGGSGRAWLLGKFGSSNRTRTPNASAGAGGANQNSNEKQPSMAQKILGRNKRQDHGDLENLTIPRATMTGMRTAIRGPDGRFLDTGASGEDTLVGDGDVWSTRDAWSTRSVSTDAKVYSPSSLSEGGRRVSPA